MIVGRRKYCKLKDKYNELQKEFAEFAEMFAAIPYPLPEGCIVTHFKGVPIAELSKEELVKIISELSFALHNRAHEIAKRII